MSGHLGVSFALAEGKVVREVPPTHLLRYALSQLIPIRRPNAFKGQTHLPGLEYLATLKRHVAYESQLERQALQLMDIDRRLVDVLPQPFVIHYTDQGKARRHIPDFLAEFQDGRRCIIDVKPREFAEQPRHAEAFAACQAVADLLDWAFLLQTEPSETRIMNTRWLLGFRRPPLGCAADLDQIEAVVATGSLTFGELLAKLGGHEALMRPRIFHLLCVGRLECDMDQQFDESMLIKVARREGT